MPHLQTSAGRVAYTDTGTGPMLVLLHATLHDRHDYDPVLPALAASHRVIAVDWPGHGESDADAGGRQVTAPLLADVLEQIVLEQDLRDLGAVDLEALRGPPEVELLGEREEHSDLA